MKINYILYLLFATSFLFTIQANSNIPTDLQCNFRKNPFGVDVTNPVLGWTINTNPQTRAMHQTGYRILVAASEEDLKNGRGNLWDSGKVISDQMGQIVYSGVPLLSSQACWWKVKIWNGQGKSSEWSKPARWIMGVLKNTDWKAQWISASGADKYAHQYASARSDFNLWVFTVICKSLNFT